MSSVKIKKLLLPPKVLPSPDFIRIHSMHAPVSLQHVPRSPGRAVQVGEEEEKKKKKKERVSGGALSNVKKKKKDWAELAGAGC